MSTYLINEEFVHNDGIGLRRIITNLIKSENITESVICSICLENIEVGASAKVIPGCQHKFHEPCIVPWLLNNLICPYCRNAIDVRGNI